MILISVLAVDVTDAEICRQPFSPDFGSTVIAESNQAFVITPTCPESSLTVRKPIQLTVRLSPEESQLCLAASIESLNQAAKKNCNLLLLHCLDSLDDYPAAIKPRD